MHNEHNPVAQIIYNMQAHWRQKIKPGTALVRWLLKANEHRMYEGFCRLEASPHGGVDELFVFFYTPFESAETYSCSILRDWIIEIENENNRAIAAKAGIGVGLFDLDFFEKQLSGTDSTDFDALLIQFMMAFRQLGINKQLPLVLSVLPKTMSNAGGFAQWIDRFANQDIPVGMRLLVFDHTEGNYWGNIFEQYHDRAVTLHQNLHLEAAIRQIATGGDAQSPDVQFRRCMYEMGEAAAKKKPGLLHEWGKKGIETGTRSGKKSLLATAHITYAGMLFTFKEFNTIHTLLDNGMRVCKQSVAAGDEGAKSLLLQFHGYKAAAFQHQKETRQALEWFMKQGREAKQFEYYSQSIAAYYKAFLMAQYKNKYEEQALALKEALYNTPFLRTDEIQSSEYPYIAYEYMQLVKLRMVDSNEEMTRQVENKMEEVYGAGWSDTVKQMQLNYNKKEVQIKEAAARVG